MQDIIVIFLPEQRDFGYNDFYDEVFRMGTNMNKKKMEFNTVSGKYALWMWKGDYWNLHSGAEIGLYKYDGTYHNTEHFNAINFEIPMRLSLYDYKNKNDIDTIFNWAPKDNQWWVTGFSGLNSKYKKVNCKNMKVIGYINLSSKKYLYNGLKSQKEKNSNIRKYLIFDDKSCIIWVNWYE